MVLFDYCEFNIIVKRQVSFFDLHANLVEIGQIILLLLEFLFKNVPELFLFNLRRSR